MNVSRARIVAAALGIGAAVAGASAHAVVVITVTEPWVRPGTLRGSSEAYLALASSDARALVTARSDAAASVVIRGPDPAARIVSALPVPAGTVVKLAPGANRLQLNGLRRTLMLGARVPIVLVLEAPDGARQEVAVDAEVRRRAPTDDERRAHAHPR